MTSLQRSAAVVAAALSMAACVSHPVTAHAHEEPATVTQEDQVARTTVDGDGAMLEVAFDPAGSRLAVRYRISNTGGVPLAVFDRGDRHAVLTKRLVAGEVPAPRFEAGAEGLTLSHFARALPDPAPTVPPVPLAAKLEPGAALDGSFVFDLSLGPASGRVRWCLGVAPFDAAFQASESAGEVAVWTAPFEVADTQQRLCTGWFDVAAGAFVDG